MLAFRLVFGRLVVVVVVVGGGGVEIEGVATVTVVDSGHITDHLQDLLWTLHTLVQLLRHLLKQDANGVEQI